MISPMVIQKVDMMVEESRSFRFQGPLNLEQGQMQTRQMEWGWWWSYLERKPEGADETKASFSAALTGDRAGEEGLTSRAIHSARAEPRAGSKQTDTVPAWPPTCLNNFKYWKLCADRINDVVDHKVSQEIILINKLATKSFSIYILYFKVPSDWERVRRD